MGSKKSTNSNSGGGGRGDGRKETNRRRNEINPNVIEGGTKKVKKDIGFNQKKHPTEGIVDSYALKSKKGGTGMYGEEVSKTTNEYLVSIILNTHVIGRYVFSAVALSKMSLQIYQVLRKNLRNTLISNQQFD